MASPTSRLPRNTWAKHRNIPYCMRDTTPGRYLRGTTKMTDYFIFTPCLDALPFPSLIITSILECLSEFLMGWWRVLMLLETRDCGTVVKCIVACGAVMSQVIPACGDVVGSLIATDVTVGLTPSSNITLTNRSNTGPTLR